MPRPSEPAKNGPKMTVVLKAMGNSRRLQILTQLADGSEKSVSEIEQLIPNLSQSALSQHLGRLRRADIVSTRRAPQTIYYSIKDADVVRILGLLSHIYADDPVLPRTRH
jgi:DNA-binding transcriptional ArsR family regulator